MGCGVGIGGVGVGFGAGLGGGGAHGSEINDFRGVRIFDVPEYNQSDHYVDWA
jgi:hypothetical protein